jgi:asparagine synthase (glutamine-hydrolysing)
VFLGRGASAPPFLFLSHRDANLMLTAKIQIPLKSPFTDTDAVALAALDSPHLRTIVESRPGRRIWCVVEHFAQPDLQELLHSTDPAESTFRSALEFDGVAIVVTDVQGQIQLHIIRTLHASVPIYIAYDTHQIMLSWDFLQCAAQKEARIDVDMCRRFIVDGPTLSNSTILHGVSLLAGGQVASWSSGKMYFEHPPNITRFLESEFCEGADAAPFFLELIASVIQPRLDRAKEAVLELSGGQDSSCVAAAIGQLNRRSLSTYGLIHDGVSGLQQAQRRAELVRRFKFSDIAVPSAQSAPFSLFLQNINIRHVPSDEIYRRGIEICLDNMPLAPDLVVTGIGGDELTLIDSSPESTGTSNAYESLFGELPKAAPEIPSVASTSAVESAFCRADMFLSRGIWPLNPLISPAVVHLCQSLPKSIKRGRMLNKIALAKVGLSDYFLFPRYRENFAEVYSNDLRRFDLLSYLQDSFLHRYGIIDITELTGQHAIFINTDKCDIPLMWFANAVRLEQILRNIN